MAATRETVLYQLSEYLAGRVSQERLYSWVLSQIMDPDYDEEAARDPALRETVQIIMDFNNADADPAPTRDDLIFYKKCLENTEEFETLKDHRARQKQEASDISKAKKRGGKPVDTRDFYAILSKVYITLFAGSVLFIYTIGIIKPALFHPGADHSSRFTVIRESLPHLVYSVFLLTPMRILIQGPLYYIALTVLIIGAVFYWYISVSIVLSYDLHILLFVLFAPFTGVPASLAVWLLMGLKNKFIKG